MHMVCIILMIGPNVCIQVPTLNHKGYILNRIHSLLVNDGIAVYALTILDLTYRGVTA